MKGYDLTKSLSELGIKFYFISTGNRNVIKAIDFSVLEWYENLEVYNLGFGDYNIETNSLDDNTYTANGDSRKVFNTVLNAIPKFFKYFPSKMILVKGSDSTAEFKDQCQRNCKRNCSLNCKKFNQRIRIYRNYLDQNLKRLNIDFQFLGGFDIQSNGALLESYTSGKNYDSIFIKKQDKFTL